MCTFEAFIFANVKELFVFRKYEGMFSRHSHISQMKFCFTDSLNKSKLLIKMETVSTKKLIEVALFFL